MSAQRDDDVVTTSHDPPRVLCIGETMVLVAPVEPRPLAEADLLRLHVAGAESTVAQYLKDLGISAAWASRVGDDPLGRRVLESIAESGVDTSLVALDAAAPTGVYFKDPGPGSTAVHYYRRGSAASRMSAEDLARFRLQTFDVVHVSGITAALSDSCRDMLETVLAPDRPARPLVSFDVNYRSRLWSADAAAPVLAELATRADIVFVGQDEAELLWGADTPPKVRERLRGHGRIVVKDGPVGATDIRDDDLTFVPSNVVDVVEVIGAGDAFAAGYLAGLLHGLMPEQALAQGHRVAAWTLTSMGDYVPGVRV